MLTLGIGASPAAFSMVKALVLQPYPLSSAADPDFAGGR
jgi:hypothetical protein